MTHQLWMNHGSVNVVKVERKMHKNSSCLGQSKVTVSLSSGIFSSVDETKHLFTGRNQRRPALDDISWCTALPAQTAVPLISLSWWGRTRLYSVHSRCRFREVTAENPPHYPYPKLDKSSKTDPLPQNGKHCLIGFYLILYSGRINQDQTT